MSTHKHTLSVKFRTTEKALLYNGASYYRSNLIDNLHIAHNELILTFERSRKQSFEEAILSPKSPARFQFYRAVCYYLAVTGALPRVRTISYSCDEKTQSIDSGILTRHWENCEIGMTLQQQSAQKCFTSKEKHYYIAITYFLKAQLDDFHHDCFRAAWSGLNAMYAPLTERKSQRNKLNYLEEQINQKTFANANALVETFPEETLWQRLSWHEYISKGDKKRIRQKLIDRNEYCDRIIFNHLSRVFLAKFNTGTEKEQKELLNQIQTQKQEKCTNHSYQIGFLVTKYCYMLRNSSFHAQKPYPVFELFIEDDELSIEERLTQLLLATIKDLIQLF